MKKRFVIRGGRALTLSETVKKYGVTKTQLARVRKLMRIR